MLWGRRGMVVSGVRGGGSGGCCWRPQSVSKQKPELGGGVGADTPLCPSTHSKAKRKFSLLEDCQEWGWGPPKCSGPRSTVNLNSSGKVGIQICLPK